ncbi:hypothetical protein MRX96_042513, partial [Rhipicephalus microplus]
MNYGTDRSEVICRTYVRKTLISEKVAYNLEDAKQVLDCAESLHPCRGAGRAKDFTYDVLTKKLEQQISHSDGLVFSVTCKGAVKQQAPRLEAAIVRCSSSTECCQEFPAADPDRSGWNPTLQVPDSASVFDLKIPPPDLRPEIRPSRSSSEDIEALNPIVLDTTEPYQTTIMLSHADTRLPRNVSFEKAQIPSYAEATAIENLPRTSPPA